MANQGTFGLRSGDEAFRSVRRYPAVPLPNIQSRCRLVKKPAKFTESAVALQTVSVQTECLNHFINNHLAGSGEMGRGYFGEPCWLASPTAQFIDANSEFAVLRRRCATEGMSVNELE